jgi:hypothetical protein
MALSDLGDKSRRKNQTERPDTLQSDRPGEVRPQAETGRGCEGSGVCADAATAFKEIDGFQSCAILSEDGLLARGENGSGYFAGRHD